MRPANSPVRRRSPVGEPGKSVIAYAIAATRSLRRTLTATLLDLRAVAADEALGVAAAAAELALEAGARLADVALELVAGGGAAALAACVSAPSREVGHVAQVGDEATARSRASSVAPTYTSAARSATLRPCLAVVFAARTLAWAASRVSFAAIVRLRRAVVSTATSRPGGASSARRSRGGACARLRAALLRAGLLRRRSLRRRGGGGGGGGLSHLVNQPLWCGTLYRT